MPILDSCCFTKNLRTASIVSGFYTLIFYTMILTTGSFHIHTVVGDPVHFPITITLVTLAAVLILCSILLLIGLFGDNKGLLVPWLIVIAIITMFEVCVAGYLLSETTYNPFIITLFFFDFFFCGLNSYAFLCVVSQYQVYYRLHRKEKRARMRRKRRERLRSGFGHEDGFDDVDNGSYGEDDEDEEEGMPVEDSEKMIQIVRIGSETRSKDRSSHRPHRHTREHERTETKRSISSRRTVSPKPSPKPSVPSTPSSPSLLSNESKVFSSVRLGPRTTIQI